MAIAFCFPCLAWCGTSGDDNAASENGASIAPVPEDTLVVAPVAQNVAAPSQANTSAPQDESKDKNKDKDADKDADKPGDSAGQQTKRMLWVVPNFGAVSADTQLPPLSTHEKFVLAAKDSVTDYSSYTWAGILAGQAMLLKSDPELGTGIKGYGRYYWRTFVDGVSGTFFTEAIVPSIMHEDPRYYTMEHGGFVRRLGYSISRAFVTKTDSGGTRFNTSEVVGNALTAGLSNAYYPPQERGLNQTATDWATQMESASFRTTSFRNSGRTSAESSFAKNKEASKSR